MGAAKFLPFFNPIFPFSAQTNLALWPVNDNTMWKFGLVTIIALLVHTAMLNATTPYFDFSSARSAYDKVISLRFTEARNEIDALKRNEPNNLAPHFIENYLECASAMLNDSEQEYRRGVKGMDKRLDKLASGDNNSPYYLYCQAEVRLQWALLRGRYGDYISCITNIKNAYSLLEENQKRFPDFVANKKSLGLLHAIVGNVPNEIRWAVKGIGGMSGTIQQGVAEMEALLNYSRYHPEFIFGIESYVAYAYMQLHINNKAQSAWKTVSEGLKDKKDNPLAMFAVANIGMKTGHNDEAIKLLEQIPTGSNYHSFPYKSFLLGIAKLYRLDTDADKPLHQFLQSYKGEFGIKEAYQKLAWFHLLKNDTQGYWNNIYQAKIQGITRADTDKAADREANKGEMPEITLLKARLLFDGGYYQRAYDLLKNAAATYAGHEKNNLEYLYRMGRVTHKLNKLQEAIQYYDQAVAKGTGKPWYFACNSALQLGILYEDRREWAKARTAYQSAIKIDTEEYAASLHARAKAGYNRVKGL
jgi:tetratricopeptide (TPR) repeat protein